MKIEVIRDIRHTGHFTGELARQFVYGQTVFPQRKSQILIPNSSRLNRLVIFEAQFLYPFEGGGGGEKLEDKQNKWRPLKVN